MLHQFFCDEHLGDIDTKQLSTMLLSLTNTSECNSSIREILGDALIESDNRLMVMGEFEYTVDTDRRTTQSTERRCVGLLIMPEHDSPPKCRKHHRQQRSTTAPNKEKLYEGEDNDELTGKHHRKAGTYRL